MTSLSGEELGTFRRFDRVKKGYDPLQVDAVLDRVTELLAEERKARRLLETTVVAPAVTVPSLLRLPARQELAVTSPPATTVTGSPARRRAPSDQRGHGRKVVASALGTLGLLRMVAAVAAGMLTMAGLADRLRDLEASGGSVFARPLLQGSARKVSALGSFYATGRKASTGYLVEVTRSCSASVMIAGFVAVAVLVALTGFRRLKPHRVLWGLFLAGVTALTVNMIRVALIAVALTRWGEGVAPITHDFLGSIVTLCSGAFAIWIGWRAAGGDSLAQTRRGGL